LTGYFLIILFAVLAQRHMLYFPDTTPPSSDNLRPFYGPALEVWPATGDPSHRGYVSAGPLAYAHNRGTVIVFHGNAGSARDRRHYISALQWNSAFYPRPRPDYMGRHDRLVNTKNAPLFDKLIPDSRLVILDDVGHAPMLEAPRISAKNIRDFTLDGR
jgi:hypothetical protein